MLVTAIGSVVVLASVNACAAEVVPRPCAANVALPVSVPVSATPVPVRFTGLRPFALLVTVSVPVRAPVAVGVKTTLIWQLPLSATEEPQLLVCAKSPVAAMLVIAIGEVPVLVSVKVCAVDAT